MIRAQNEARSPSGLCPTAFLWLIGVAVLGCGPSDSNQSDIPNIERQKAIYLSSGQAPQNLAATQFGEPLKWKSFTLSGGNQGTLAVNLTSPLDKPADLRFVFVVTADDRKYQAIDWDLIPEKGALLSHLRCFPEERDLNINIPGEELRLQNRVFFQSLDDGQINPGQNYVLWINILYGITRKVYVAARFVPHGSFPTPTTADETARDLGLSVPLQKNDLQRWKDLGAQVSLGFRTRNAELALNAVEEQVERFPVTRQNLLLAADLNISRGEQIRDRRERMDSNVFFLRAAAHMRRLKEHFGGLTEQETPVWAESLYFEAEALAAQKRKAEALTALRAARTMGFPSAGVDAASFGNIATADELKAIVSDTTGDASSK